MNRNFVLRSGPQKTSAGPKAPAKLPEELHSSPDGTMLALRRQRPAQPADIWVME